MRDNLNKTIELYYYHDGLKQCGPFTKEELKQKGIKKDTLIWHKNFTYWQKAELIPKLKELFKKDIASKTSDKIPAVNTPPPFSPKYIKEVRIAVLPRRSKILMLISAVLGLLIITGIFAAKYRKDEANYQAQAAISGIELGKGQENLTSGTDPQIAVEKMLEEFEMNGKKKEKEEEKEIELNKNKKAVRNNFRDYITVKENKYTHKEIGGIYDLSIKVSNTSKFPIDIVEVCISYIKANGNIHKVEKIYFENINPGSAISLKAPNSERGKKVSLAITSITSRSINFCYRKDEDISNKGDDPYYCK